MAQNISNTNSFTTNFDTGIPEQTDDANIIDAFTQYHYGLNYDGIGSPQGIEGHLQTITDDVQDISDSLIGVVTKDIFDGQNGILINATHINKLIRTPLNNIVTIQNDSGGNSAPVGATVYLLNRGSTKCLVATESGVTLRYTPGNYLRDQWSFATLIKIAENEWILFGDLST